MRVIGEQGEDDNLLAALHVYATISETCNKTHMSVGG